VSRNAIDRRTFLRRGSMAAAAGAALPLLGASLQGFPARAATAPPADPDQLFADGWFDAADRGYARELRQDPDNAYALAQRGYIALLSNRFGDAETFLTKALQLAPHDTFSRGQLADCYVRQDQFARAVPLLRKTGYELDAASAAQYAALAGIPYQVYGPESTRVPTVAIDPLPMIEVSVNRSAPLPVYWDTGSETMTLSEELADQLGLTPVASVTANAGGGRPVTLYFGVLESLLIGDIEV
jgi:tetratricopeptide (TPR) repeat protein